MGLSRAGFDWNSPGINILTAAFAGILIGLAGFAIKLVLGGIILDSNFIFSVLSKPLAYLAGILGLAVSFFSKKRFTGARFQSSRRL